MCVVSMVYDHYLDKWKGWTNLPPIPYYTLPIVSPLTPQEIEDFRKMLERAKEYDKRTGQPDCELDEKKKKVKDLAKELGVEISFL